MKILNNLFLSALFLFITLHTDGQTVVIKAASMLDVKKGTLISPAVILIKNGIIDEINPKKIPEGVETINLAGKVLLPGLIDMHVHLASGDTILLLEV